MATVTFRDETATGRRFEELAIADLPESMTVRELVRLWVREEVARFNATPSHHFRGLVQPDDAEIELNGYRLRTPRRLEWERQAAIAERAFSRNGYVVLVVDLPVADLDEIVDLTADPERVPQARPPGRWVSPVASARMTPRDRIGGSMPAALRPVLELLDQLDPTVFEVFETLDAAWSEHRSCYPRPRFAATPLAKAAAGFGDAELRSMGLWAQLRRYGGHGSSLFCEVLGATISAVARRQLAWQPDEVEVLWRLALAPHDTVCR